MVTLVLSRFLRLCRLCDRDGYGVARGSNEAVPMGEKMQVTGNGWKKNIVLFLFSQSISLFGSSLVQYAIMWYITLHTQSGIMMTISDPLRLSAHVLPVSVRRGMGRPLQPEAADHRLGLVHRRLYAAAGHPFFVRLRRVLAALRRLRNPRARYGRADAGDQRVRSAACAGGQAY